MTRYIVCGGRNYDNYELVRATIEQFPGNVTVVNGGATGADRLARLAARGLGLRVETYNAKWATYGKAAGPIRNRYMASLDDVQRVYAFPGGPGTADMVKCATEFGIDVVEVEDGRD